MALRNVSAAPTEKCAPGIYIDGDGGAARILYTFAAGEIRRFIIYLRCRISAQCNLGGGFCWFLYTINYKGYWVYRGQLKCDY